jgi:ABC-2 type transport system ATP-binding protein
MTIIITTHFMEEAEYCDRIAIQDAGKMLALGSPKQVRQQAGTGSSSDMNRAFIAIVEQSRAHQQSRSDEMVSFHFTCGCFNAKGNPAITQR